VVILLVFRKIKILYYIVIILNLKFFELNILRVIYIYINIKLR